MRVQQELLGMVSYFSTSVNTLQYTSISINITAGTIDKFAT